MLLNPQVFFVFLLENMKTFQFSHRFLAIIIMVYAGWYFIKTQGEFYNKFTGMLFMAFIIQFYLGIMTLLLKVPVVLGVIHQGMAALIVLILVQIKFSITQAQTINR